MTASSWPEPVAAAFKSGFPERFEGIFDACLDGAVNDAGYSEGAELAVGLRYVHPPVGFGLPRLEGHEIVYQPGTPFGRLDQELIHPRSVLAMVLLRYSSHTYQG